MELHIGVGMWTQCRDRACILLWVNQAFVAKSESPCSCHRAACEGWNTDLITMGVNSHEIEKFCRKLDIPMYALDDDEKSCRSYTPKNRNKKAPALMYRVR